MPAWAFPRLRYIFSLIRLGCSIILPIVLILLPVDFFDNGPPICLSRILLDVECLACGLTRASMRVIHLDFAAAAQFNKMVFFILPLVIYLWAKYIYLDYKYLRRSQSQ